MPFPHTTLTILGSGTLFPDHRRHAAAHYIDSGCAKVLFDCGAGTLHGLSQHAVDWEGITHVAITHYHTDHVGELSALLFALKYGILREEPLTLIGPPGFTVFIERLGVALGTHITDPGFELRIAELGPDETYLDPERDVQIRSFPTPHNEESVAYRYEGRGSSIGYTGDTGPSERVAAFLLSCRVLIAECTLTDPTDMTLHLSPTSLAQMAQRVQPELLVVTHVSPPADPNEAVARITECGFDGQIVAGIDGLHIRFDEFLTWTSSGTPS
jgi:ribonuclease BN (tRNA processing enzyme)